MAQASIPHRAIEKGRPGPGLLAHVVSAEYGDHATPCQQEQIFARHRVHVTRRALSKWSRAVAELLEPVARTTFARILESRWVQSDSPADRGSGSDRKPAGAQRRMWVHGSEMGDVGDDST